MWHEFSRPHKLEESHTACLPTEDGLHICPHNIGKTTAYALFQLSWESEHGEGFCPEFVLSPSVHTGIMATLFLPVLTTWLQLDKTSS